MPGTDTLNGSATPARRTAAALELAYQIRKELMERPLPPPEHPEQPIYRLVHYVDPACLRDPEEAPIAARVASPPEPDETENTATVSADELKRLRRIVNMLTTAMGELNLWLVNVGREPVEIEL